MTVVDLSVIACFLCISLLVTVVVVVAVTVVFVCSFVPDVYLSIVVAVVANVSYSSSPQQILFCAMNSA